MTWGTARRYRVINVKRGDPHTVYLGDERSAGDAWTLSATISTKDALLTRDLEQCRRARGLLDLELTNEDELNTVKLSRISIAVRRWQQTQGRGGRRI
jgi:hypothetical protein